MTRDEAIDELVIREQEFRQLQVKILSLRMTAQPVDVIVPVVTAIVECQLRIHQLQRIPDLASDETTVADVGNIQC